MRDGLRKQDLDDPGGGACAEGELERAARRRVGRPLRVSLLLGFLLLALLALSPAAALALRHRGHVFERSFGKSGAAGGDLKGPAGVAIDESSGDVYVADKKNNRIDRFTSSGEFVETWGWGVKDGKEEFERCTAAEKCEAGIAGEGEGQFSEPEWIAVDNSTSSGDPSVNDVYVVGSSVSARTNAIEKFTASGEYLGRLTADHESLPDGVAVDGTGDVWLYGGGWLEEFSDAQPNVLLNSHEPQLSCQAPGFAVNAAATAFYLAHQEPEFNFREGVLECKEAVPSKTHPAVIAQLEGLGQPLIEALDPENSSAVAVDQSSGKESSGDVYVDNTTSIAAFEENGTFIQRFGEEAELKTSEGVAVNAKTGDVYATDAAKGLVDVFAPISTPGAPQVDTVTYENLSPTSTVLVAGIDPDGETTTYQFEYGTSPCSGSCTKVAPGTLEPAFGDRRASAVLEGLSPGTLYYFRVVAENSHGKSEGAHELHTFTTLPSPLGVLADGRRWELVSPSEKRGANVDPLGQGFIEPQGGLDESSEDGSAFTYATTSPIEVSPESNSVLEGIQVLAQRQENANHESTWSSKEIVTPRTQANGFVNEGQEYRDFSTDLARALVSPPFGNSGVQEPALVGGAASEELNLYVRNNFTCLTTNSGCYERLVTPGEDDTLGTPFGGHLEEKGATADLSHVVLASTVRLTENTPEEAEGGLYEWNSDGTLSYVSVRPTTSHGKPVPALVPQLGHETIQSVSTRNAISSDGRRIFWVNGEEEPPASPRLFMTETESGKSFWVNEPEAGVKRIKTQGEESEEEEEEAGLNEVRFQIATPDGSRVFFTDTDSLTTEAKLTPEEGGPADLYVCEVAEGPACKLKDLTVDENPGEDAEVVGSVLGINEEGEQGSYVYFVANGALAPGAIHGNCDTVTRSHSHVQQNLCNLYLVHYDATDAEWERPKLIAVLSGEDYPDWESTHQNPSAFTARVSPNGRYLAFMSQQALTGASNADINSGKPDEQVFLYDAGATITPTSGELRCVSCSPTGQQPRGVFDTLVSGEGLGLVVDPDSGVWGSGSGGRWLAGVVPGYTPVSEREAPYQSRYLLNDGRLFFDSSDALVSQATNTREETAEGHTYTVGMMNVYEFEPEGVGSCAQAGGCVSLISSGTAAHESAFLDASTSGDDVFFVTDQPLVRADRDADYDVYDARVCSGAAPACPTEQAEVPPPCTSEATCRPGGAPNTPAFASPSFSGPANSSHVEVLPYREGSSSSHTKPTNAQKLAKALKTCRAKYKHSKSKRATCERKARRQYAPKKKKKSSKK